MLTRSVGQRVSTEDARTEYLFKNKMDDLRKMLVASTDWNHGTGLCIFSSSNDSVHCHLNFFFVFFSFEICPFFFKDIFLLDSLLLMD